MASSSQQYPYDTVVYITDTIGGATYQGSGVLVAPDEVLTASHLVWDVLAGAANASSITVTPGYDAGYAPFGKATVSNYHYFQVDDFGGELSADQSASDFALLHLNRSFNIGTMAIKPDFGGGVVTITGYPGSAGGRQSNGSVNAVRNQRFHVLDFTVSGSGVSPGSSGGPLWVGGNSNPSVVGIVSTLGTAALLTSSDQTQIEGWIVADHGVPGGSGTPDGLTVADTFAPDFYHSGISGILFQNANSGLVLDWKLSGGAYDSNTPIAGAAPGWVYRGTGKFSGDGTSDILFQNLNSGLILYWTINQGAYQTDVPIAGATSDWSYVGSGDFYDNGNSDILFRNLNTGLLLDWKMVGGHFVGNDAIAGATADWTFLGTGDFNGDGTSDILFQNANSGQLLFWQVANGAYQNAVTLAGNTSGMKFLGLGDFNGDGTSDLLMQNTQSGQLFDWSIKKGAIAGSTALATPPAGWQYVGTGDFTGNGMSDILFQETKSGLMSYWNIAAGLYENTVTIAGASAGWSPLHG